MWTQLLQHARKLLSRHNLACALTLCAFVVSSTGLPLQPMGRCALSCRCDESLSAAGQCCCTKARRSAIVSSCCEMVPKRVAEKSCCKKQISRYAKTPSTAKSCCAGESITHDKTTPPFEHCNSIPVNVPVISACGCGTTPDEGIATNVEPRNICAVVIIVDLPNLEHWLSAVEVFSSGPSLPPETPPPKVRLSQTVCV